MQADAEQDRAAVVADLAALRTGAAVSRLGDRALLATRGTDRTSFLQGMLSNDVASLAAGDGTHALLLTEQGRLVAELNAFVLPDAIWLETPLGLRARVREALERYVVADDVEFDDLGASGVAVRGPASAEVLGAVLAGEGGRIEALAGRAHLDAVHDGRPLRVARVDDLGVRGFHLWCETPDAAAALVEALVAAGGREVGEAALEVARIARGLAREGVDYSTETLAAEIPSLAPAVSYRKGCYLGQEVMERVAARGHVNWLLVGLTAEDDASLAPGAALHEGEREVGKVTSVARRPDDGRTIALARVRAGVAEPGRRLVAKTGEREAGFVVSSSPRAGDDV